MGPIQMDSAPRYTNRKHPGNPDLVVSPSELAVTNPFDWLRTGEGRNVLADL